MNEAMLPVKRDVRRSFDRAARTYDEAAFLQREVCARLVEHLEPMRLSPRRLLDLGCGTGHAFDALAKRYPSASLLGLDIAPAIEVSILVKQLGGRLELLAPAEGLLSITVWIPMRSSPPLESGRDLSPPPAASARPPAQTISVTEPTALTSPSQPQFSSSQAYPSLPDLRSNSRMPPGFPRV